MAVSARERKMKQERKVESCKLVKGNSDRVSLEQWSGD